MWFTFLVIKTDRKSNVILAALFFLIEWVFLLVIVLVNQHQLEIFQTMQKYSDDPTRAYTKKLYFKCGI